jgi:hypothetical protein
LTDIIHPQELHNAVCKAALWKTHEGKNNRMWQQHSFARQKISAQKEFGNIIVAFQTVDTQILLHW